MTLAGCLRCPPGRSNSQQVGRTSGRPAAQESPASSRSFCGAAVRDALINTGQHSATQLKRSLTWDQGTEMAAHHGFSIATNVVVKFPRDAGHSMLTLRGRVLSRVAVGSP